MPPGPVAEVAQAKAFAAEKNVAWVRVAVITFNVPVYWAWLAPQGVPWLAMAITVIALVYGWGVAIVAPYRKLPVLRTTAWTAATDASLITLWIHATGGYASPFYLLWYLSLFAITFRYDWRATALTAVLYSVLYGMVVSLSEVVHWPTVLVRVAYILLVGAIGSLLARESQRLFAQTYQMGQAVQQAERFRTLAEASPEALVIHRKGILLEANPAFCRLVGAPRDQVIGQPASEFVEADSLPTLAQRIDGPEDTPLELWVRGPTGRRLVRIQGRDIEYEGAQARLAAMHDVTEERQAQEARQAAERSQQEVLRLREMDRFKTEFINAAAHELNTPITPLKLQLHVLKQRLADRDGPERRSLELLERNLNRLSLLVQDMLDVARLESGRLRLRLAPVDVATLAGEIAETFGENAARHGLTLETDVQRPLVVRGDPDRLLQVLFNLVSNAIKFTPPGGRIRVTGRAEGQEAVVTVQDSGIGLTAAQAARLFQPFGRLHVDIHEAPGTGLGLYISKGIVEAHGGAIAIASPGPGQGASATVHVPLAGPAPAQAARQGSADGPPMPQPGVLARDGAAPAPAASGP